MRPSKSNHSPPHHSQLVKNGDWLRVQAKPRKFPCLAGACPHFFTSSQHRSLTMTTEPRSRRINGLPVVLAAQQLVRLHVDALAEEGDVAVAEEEVCPPRVPRL